MAGQDTALINTALTERLGIRLPVVVAPMSGVSDGRLAVAASRAGVLGSIGVGGTASGEFVRHETSVAAESGLPYGVGLMGWALRRRPDQLDAVLAARPALVSVSYGDYAPYLGPLRDAGITVVTQVGSVEQAMRAEEAGVDFVVSRGAEGGGHGYDLVGTLPLLQAVLERLEVPVLAAGGIGTGRGLAAVLAAGAAGAWVGSAFVTCRESAASDDQVALLGEADEVATAYGRVFDVASAIGWPDDIGGRALRNEFFDAWRGREEELPGDADALAAFRSAAERRDFSTMPVYIGQGVGLLDGERPTAAEVVERLAGAASLLSAAAGRVSGGGRGE
jgi:nitronate monooxygenase